MTKNKSPNNIKANFDIFNLYTEKNIMFIHINKK